MCFSNSCAMYRSSSTSSRSIHLSSSCCRQLKSRSLSQTVRFFFQIVASTYPRQSSNLAQGLSGWCLSSRSSASSCLSVGRKKPKTRLEKYTPFFGSQPPSLLVQLASHFWPQECRSPGICQCSRALISRVVWHSSRNFWRFGLRFPTTRPVSSQRSYALGFSLSATARPKRRTPWGYAPIGPFNLS